MAMKTIKLLLIALLFVACGGNEAPKTQQKKANKVTTTKKTVKKSKAVDETATTDDETTITMPVQQNVRENENTVEYTVPEETVAAPVAAPAPVVDKKPSYSQAAEVKKAEEKKEVQTPVNQSSVTAPVEQPSANVASNVFEQPQSMGQFGFKNFHSLRAAIGAFKFFSPETYYKPIPSIELGYMFVSQPNDVNFYTEIGANLMFAYGNISKEKEFDSKVVVRAALLSINIPFNLGYNFKINNDWSISPYIGVYQRVYIFGNTKTIATVGKDVVKTRTNLFKDSKTNANWHQVGMHAGLKLNYKKYSYGAVFGYDFLEFDKSRNVMTWGLNFGYTF